MPHPYPAEVTGPVRSDRARSKMTSASLEQSLRRNPKRDERTKGTHPSPRLTRSWVCLGPPEGLKQAQEGRELPWGAISASGGSSWEGDGSQPFPRSPCAGFVASRGLPWLRNCLGGPERPERRRHAERASAFERARLERAARRERWAGTSRRAGAPDRRESSPRGDRAPCEGRVLAARVHLSL